jgi:ribosome maturation factor RimP
LQRTPLVRCTPQFLGALHLELFTGSSKEIILKFDPVLEEIRQAAEPVIQSQGMELVDVEYQREAPGWVLRIYIDRAGGVNIDDCAEVSRELGTILEVRDLIPNSHLLEVSSPGLTRPLKKLEEFQKYRNCLVKIKTFAPVEGRRNFKGKLLGVEGDLVQVEVDGRSYGIPQRSIAKANLEIEF